MSSSQDNNVVKQETNYTLYSGDELLPDQNSNNYQDLLNDCPSDISPMDAHFTVHTYLE